MYEALQYHSMVLDILCLTYFLISITMPDPQTSDMRQIPYTLNDVCASYLARVSMLTTLCLNHLLAGDLCKKFLYFHILSLFSGFQT